MPMSGHQPAPKKKAAFKYFDELAAEGGEDAIIDMTMRDIARRLSERMGMSVHQSSVADWKRAWLDGRDDRAREEEAARNYFRFSPSILANLWRVHPNARGFALATAYELDRLVYQGATPPAKLPGPYVARGVFSFVRLCERNGWRIREHDRESFAATVAELDSVLVDRETITAPEGANELAWHQALTQAAHEPGMFPPSGDEVNANA